MWGLFKNINANLEMFESNLKLIIIFYQYVVH